MDPYIINNMPDDSREDPTPEADLVLTDGHTAISLMHDGDSYVLLFGEYNTSGVCDGAVIAAFDPTVDLEVALSFIGMLRQSTVASGSAEANQVAIKLGAYREQPNQ